MLTLRTGSGKRERGHRPLTPLSRPVLPQPDQEPVACCGVCPQCKQDLTVHAFTTSDGLAIITYHCREHGDVIPMRCVIVCDYS